MLIIKLVLIINTNWHYTTTQYIFISISIFLQIIKICVRQAQTANCLPHMHVLPQSYDHAFEKFSTMQMFLYIWFMQFEPYKKFLFFDCILIVIKNLHCF